MREISFEKIEGIHVFGDIESKKNLFNCKRNCTGFLDFILKAKKLKLLSILGINLVGQSNLLNGICKLSELRNLSLTYTRLTKLPNSISKLKNLISINLSYNNLSNGSLKKILNLPNTTNITMLNNNIKSVNLNNIKSENLHGLDLRNNAIKEIISTKDNLKNSFIYINNHNSKVRVNTPSKKTLLNLIQTYGSEEICQGNIALDYSSKAKEILLKYIVDDNLNKLVPISRSLFGEQNISVGESYDNMVIKDILKSMIALGNNVDKCKKMLSKLGVYL